VEVFPGENEAQCRRVRSTATIGTKAWQVAFDGRAKCGSASLPRETNRAAGLPEQGRKYCLSHLAIQAAVIPPQREKPAAYSQHSPSAYAAFCPAFNVAHLSLCAAAILLRPAAKTVCLTGAGPVVFATGSGPSECSRDSTSSASAVPARSTETPQKIDKSVALTPKRRFFSIPVNAKNTHSLQRSTLRFHWDAHRRGQRHGLTSDKTYGKPKTGEHYGQPIQ
jgi:hypothetical protein